MTAKPPPQTLKIDKDSYPALFNIADQVSVAAQRKFLRLVAADLIFLIIGTILSAISLCGVPAIAHINLPLAIAIGMGVTFGISLCLTIVLRTMQYEKIWYSSRAFAEAVRAMAWHYMTCAQPYPHTLTLAQADGELADTIFKLIEDQQSGPWMMSAELGDSREITDDMRTARQLSSDARRQLYVRDRLKDQIAYYSGKAKDYRKSEERWFMFIIFAQFLAFVSAIIYVQWYNQLHLNIISIFATLATVLFSWLQVKQYQELAQSYSLTAHQLGLLHSGKEPHISNDTELSEFVVQAEEIMGREHTLWKIRRDQHAALLH